MSWIKLPCILVANVGIYRTFTPPNVSAKGEQLPVITLWDWYLSLSRSVINPLKTIICGIGIAEAAAILAYHYPSWPLSTFTLSTLLPRNNPTDLRLTPVSTTGMLLIVCGALLREFCYRAMRDFFTFEVSIQKGHQLITTGPYGVVRHPAYSGMSAIYVGMACWYGSRGSWLRESGVLDTAGGQALFGSLAASLVAVLVGLLKRMSLEDAALKNNFREEWAEWARKVPYSLIPWVY